MPSRFVAMRRSSWICDRGIQVLIAFAAFGVVSDAARLEDSPLMRGWLDHVQSFPAHLQLEVPVAKSTASSAKYNFKEHWFEQNIDHVNKQQFGRWKQRYFVYDKFSRLEQNFPLFVFCGAEQGDIFQEWERLGFMLEVARLHGAKVLWLEHRFFGQSVLFDGQAAFETRVDRVGLLSLEQSLADYAAIIRAHRGEGPVLTFGGSLSGTIAAMLRVEEPALVDMAFASSAPILGVDGVADPFAWRARLTATFAELGGPRCPDLVRRGFAAMTIAMADVGGIGGQRLRRAFRPCDSKDVSVAQWQGVYSQAWAMLESLGNFVYPSASSAIPAACKRMEAAASDEEIFARLLGVGVAAAADSNRCLNFTRPPRGAMPPSTTAGWSYMACTEVIHPIAANNKTDMFPPYNWTVEGLSSTCKQAWHVVPDASYMQRKIAFRVKGFGANATVRRSDALPGRILFTYGDYDPWGTMVPKQGWSDDVKIIRVPGGSHCSDLETARENDTPDMLEARQEITAVLSKWIGEVQKQRVMKVNRFGRSLEKSTSIKKFGSHVGLLVAKTGYNQVGRKTLRGRSSAAAL